MKEVLRMKNNFDYKKGLITFLLIVFLGSGAIYNQNKSQNKESVPYQKFLLQKMNLVLKNHANLGYYPKDIYEVKEWLEKEHYPFSYSTYPLFGWKQDTNQIVSYHVFPRSLTLFSQKIYQPSNLHAAITWIKEKNVDYAKLDIMQNITETLSIETKNYLVLDFHQNQINSDSHGISLHGNGKIRIQNAQITCKQDRAAGIAIFDQPNVEIDQCTIESSCYGITENPNSTKRSTVKINNCTVRSPYPLYLCANGQYRIDQSIFYGESVFTSGDIWINNSQFLSETTLAEALDSEYVCKQFLSLKPQQCESYGDSILIVNHRERSSAIQSFKINNSTVYIPMRNQVTLGYGIRYIDLDDLSENYIFSSILQMKNITFSTLFSPQQKILSAIDVYCQKK